MAQVTDHITLRNVKAEISTDGTTWTNISGAFNSLEIGGGERETGEVYTAEGDLPLVGTGKMKLTDVKFKVVYTEGDNDPWRKFWDAFTDATSMYFRYSPKGGNTGDLRFTSGKGFVTKPALPQGDVGDGKPLLCELQFTCPGFTDEKITA